MVHKTARTSLLVLGVLVCAILPATAQQHGQWPPGQSGLNAGAMAEPGFTYTNLTINYSADSLKTKTGDTVPVEGTYAFWAVENIFMVVPNVELLGARFGVMALVPLTNGSPTVPQFGFDAGGYGVGDVWIQPAILGWRLVHG